MSTSGRAVPDEMPEGLKPRLRLFLSVDLVGSTAFKQRAGASWQPEIVSFYRNFDHILHKQFREYGKSLGSALGRPEFWKSNGDELLYTWEIQNLTQVHAVINIWMQTLLEYRAITNHTSRRLDVKSTAWIGLFPYPNFEVFFLRRAVDEARRENVDDSLLLQSEMREDWYSPDRRYDLTKEYVGPSIDTGFRLTSWASPRRLIISVDLAFLLASSFMSDLEPLPFRLGGKGKLKGIIDDEPYPIIWLPVEDERIVEGGGQETNANAAAPAYIRSYCESIIEQHYTFITPIFLSVETSTDYGWVPPYILKHILALWREETDYQRNRSVG